MKVLNTDSPPFTATMQYLQNETLVNHHKRALNIVISGGGPAGLIRAIHSISKGHFTTLLEKRQENAKGRKNTVHLELRTIQILKDYGVYQLLLDNQRIYPISNSGVNVRIKDLEQAMKVVIAHLSPDRQVIHYASTIHAVNANDDEKANILALSNGEIKKIENVDFLVNAEGSKSTTNKLLGITRQEVLPKLPAIAVIFKDTRPYIDGFCSFFSYIGKTILYTAASLYYWAIYLFKMIFQGECFCNQNRDIAGSVILKTPGQHYLGVGFTPKVSDQLIALKAELKNHRQALQDSLNQDEAHCHELQKNLEQAEANLNSFAHYWINVSFCAGNVLAAITCCRRGFDSAGWHPLECFEVVEIGADKSSECAMEIGRTNYLVAGDAFATVDPTTGKGCNSAIYTTENFFHTLLMQEEGFSQDTILKTYRTEQDRECNLLHLLSRLRRNLYRPDAS